MSERQVGFYSPEQVADGWLASELGRTLEYKLDTLSRPGSALGALDVQAIMHRHVERFWAQDEDYMARAKWLIGKRPGRAWNRFKKWYNEGNLLVLIPRVELDNSETIPQEATLAELCSDYGIPVEAAIMAAKRGQLSAWKPPRIGWMTHRGTFAAWAERYKPRAKRGAA